MSSEHEPRPPSSRPRSARPSSSHAKSHKITTTSSKLRDTLASFGDDLVKVKDTSFLYNEGLQEGIADPSRQIQFERVPSYEVGARSTRWRKAIAAGLFASPGRRDLRGRRIGDTLENQDDESSANSEKTPPFWGVTNRARRNVSMLSLQLILHEVACFTSSVLFGCLLVYLFKGMPWTYHETSHWAFNRVYEAIVITFLVFTSLGFLIRIDTSDAGSLLLSPLYIIPAGLLMTSIYLVKAWELQREECLQYWKMPEDYRKHVFLTQNCDFYRTQEDKKDKIDVAFIVMSVIPIMISFTISSWLFAFRNKFYLTERFTPKV